MARARGVFQVILTVAAVATLTRAASKADPSWNLSGTTLWTWLFLVALSLLQVLAATARWHHVLRHHRASVHPGATLRTLLAERWMECIRWFPGAATLNRGEVYVHWFDRSPEAVQRSVLNDRALQGLAALVGGGLGVALTAAQGRGFNAHGAGLAALLFCAAAALEWFWGWKAWSLLPVRPGKDRRELAAAFGYALLEQAFHVAAIVVALQAAGFQSASWIPVATLAAAARLAAAGSRFLEGWGVRELVLFLVAPAGSLPTHVILSAGAALLTVHIGWLAFGAWHLRRQEHRHRDSLPQPARTLSVVLPALNEAAGITEAIRRARAVPQVSEILVVDGGSTDATREIATQEGCRVLQCSPGRGGQMRLGAQSATGDVVLFLHADTWLEPDAGLAVLQSLRDPTVVAGGFWKTFRDTPLLLLGSRPKCAIRLFVGRRIVGDMAMFVRREALERIGGVPEMELMEDFELSKRLRQRGRLALADSTVTTSARRFVEKGVVSTYLKMWRVATLYRLGKSPAELRRIYG